MNIKQTAKKIFKVLIILVLAYFAFYGAYKKYYNSRINSVKNYVEARDKTEKVYDDDFLFQKPDGEPMILVKPENNSTVFFVGGFRAAHFYNYFLKLHNDEGVNVIAPVAGLTSWPFEMRNREWFFQEDMRAFYQYYNLYTANLPKDHRVVVVSMSFGALSNTVLGARAERKPDVQIFLSPLNTRLNYRAASPLMAWLSGKITYVKYLIPMIVRTSNPSRAGMWDIVNDEMNIAAWNEYGTRVVNWEENLQQAVKVREAAAFMENTLVKKVSGQKVIIIYGDDDLFFDKNGFTGLGKLYSDAGNSVRIIELKKTGHMILNDNGGATAKKLIADAAHGKLIFPENSDVEIME